jgi:hypothetical protein
MLTEQPPNLEWLSIQQETDVYSAALKCFCTVVSGLLGEQGN